MKLEIADIVQWADQIANDLERDMIWQTNEYGGWWKATESTLLPEITARATAAIGLLDRFAGPQSTWAVQGRAVLESKGDNQSTESGARALAPLLREWVKQLSSGAAQARAIESQDLRFIAGTDLMEQVEILLADDAVHAAAPIALAGAALEMALRSVAEEHGVAIKKRAGINDYAKKLREQGVLTRQDVKDITQMAGLRNAAAHGEFAELSRERAGLLAQQVNMFLRTLELRTGRDHTSDAPVD